MFQNKFFLIIVALGANQAVPHNKSYEVKPDCNKSYPAGHHKSNSHSYKSVYGDAYSLSVKDKIDVKSQGSFSSDLNSSISKLKGLNNSDNIKDHLKATAELKNNNSPNDNSNKDNIHTINNQSSSSHEKHDGINKDSSNVKKVKSEDSSKPIDEGIQTGTFVEENIDIVKEKSSVSSQLDDLKINDNKTKPIDTKHSKVDVNHIGTNVVNSGSLNNNSLVSNDIKNLDPQQTVNTINSLNNKNEANLDIKDNKLEASDNSSNNINILSQPNQQNSNSVDLNNNMDTLLKAISSDQTDKPTPGSNNIPSSATTSAPTIITDYSSQKTKPNTKSDSKVKTVLLKDKVDDNHHDEKTTYNQSYGQYNY